MTIQAQGNNPNLIRKKQNRRGKTPELAATPRSPYRRQRKTRSVAGSGSRPDVNQFLRPYFISYNLKKGWFLKWQLTLTAN